MRFPFVTRRRYEELLDLYAATAAELAKSRALAEERRVMNAVLLRRRGVSDAG